MTLVEQPSAFLLPRSHRCRFLYALVAIALLGTMTTPHIAPARAQPPIMADDPAINVIAWDKLGLSSRRDLGIDNPTAEASLPVPQGVVPASVTGMIGSVVNVSGGQVDVIDSRGTLLGSIPVPAGLSSEPFAIETSAAEVVGGIANLTFVLRGAENPERCSQVPALALTQLTTILSGQEISPSTVADFLPVYLDSIVIYVGPRPSSAQQQAALSLVARLSHLYRSMPVRIVVDTSWTPPPPPNDGFTRVVEIRDGGPRGISVKNGGTPFVRLVISGSGPELDEQVALFAHGRMLLAQTPYSRVTGVSEQASVSQLTMSFGDLGIAGQSSVLGTTNLYAGIDVSRFALGSVQSAKIHLRAHYNSVKPGQGSVLVKAGSSALASSPLDESGVLDVEVTVPPDLITSNIALNLDIRYSPEVECPLPTDGMAFTIDPASSISLTPGPDSRTGFIALPVAFTPGFDVAVDRPDRIRYAARALSLIAQQTEAVLRPRIQPIDQVSQSPVGLLVVSSTGWLTGAGLNPPLMNVDGTSVRIDGSPIFDVELEGQLGVVQAFSNNGRTVVAISGPDESDLIDRTLDYVSGLDGMWASLSGDVVATGAAGTTVNLTVRSSKPQAIPGVGWMVWVWVTAAVTSAALLVAAVVLFARWRRSRARS
ncbi:MAG: hypothetical protein U5N53_00365 [Mycobacterium sp.]|nr:hypothetical protein [Mycobacterium sp.]